MIDIMLPYYGDVALMQAAVNSGQSDMAKALAKHAFGSR
jgi:hypothetical protein